MSITVRRLLPLLLQPVLGVLFLVVWGAVNRGGIISVVATRSDTFSTNPYVVLIAIGLALALAFSRVSPITSYSIVGGLLLIQTSYWPARFSQTSWDAYLVLPLVGVFVSCFGGRIFRWIALALSVVFAGAVSALLNLPILSISGRFGTINGKPNSTPDLSSYFWSWAVVGAGLAVGAWFIGVRLRRRRPEAGATDSAMTSSETFHPESEAIGSLSDRERQIFMLAADGKSNKAIAESASIEESTVKTHLNSISSKLGLSSRMELVAFAYREGVVEPSGRDRLTAADR